MWSARTGTVATPTPLQQKSLKRAHEAAKAQTLALPAPSISQMVELDPAELAEWQVLPASFLRCFRELVHRCSSATVAHAQLAAHVESLSAAQFITPASLKQAIAPATVAHKEMCLLRDKLNARDEQHARKELEHSRAIAQLNEQISQLKAKVAQQEIEIKKQHEETEEQIKHTQRDIKERGLIMARLSDRLTDEMSNVLSASDYHCAEVQQLHKRVELIESRGGPFSTHANTKNAANSNILTQAQLHEKATSHHTVDHHPLTDALVAHESQYAQQYMKSRDETEQASQQLVSSTAPPNHVSAPAAHIISAAPHTSFPANLSQPSLHRYLADYTTRNLQRDLLEIAETYQSTIRNEVDTLRAQMVQIRRQQAETNANMQEKLNQFGKEMKESLRDFSFTISNSSTFLHDSIQKLNARMDVVEGRQTRVEQESQSRYAQVELHYQDRNEEIRSHLASLEHAMGSASINLGTGDTLLSAKPRLSCVSSPPSVPTHREEMNQLNHEMLLLSAQVERWKSEYAIKYERLQHAYHSLCQHHSNTSRSLGHSIDSTFASLRAHVIDPDAHTRAPSIHTVKNEQKYAFESLGKHARSATAVKTHHSARAPLQTASIHTYEGKSIYAGGGRVESVAGTPRLTSVLAVQRRTLQQRPHTTPAITHETNQSPLPHPPLKPKNYFIRPSTTSDHQTHESILFKEEQVPSPLHSPSAESPSHHVKSSSSTPAHASSNIVPTIDESTDLSIDQSHQADQSQSHSAQSQPLATWEEQLSHDSQSHDADHIDDVLNDGGSTQVETGEVSSSLPDQSSADSPHSPLSTTPPPPPLSDEEEQQPQQLENSNHTVESDQQSIQSSSIQSASQQPAVQLSNATSSSSIHSSSSGSDYTVPSSTASSAALPGAVDAQASPTSSHTAAASSTNRVTFNTKRNSVIVISPKSETPT